MSECYTIGGDNWQPLVGFDITAQTFTPLESHIIDFFDAELWLSSTIPPEIALTLCDALHEPTGPIITYGHLTEPIIYLPGMRGRVRFKLDTPVFLEKGKIYSMWMYRDIKDIGPTNQWLYDKDDATYPRGHIIFSDDGGHTWTHFPNSDFIFCEFGNPPAPESPPNPPINNFTLINITRIYTATGCKIIASTNVPCHLYMDWTTVPPRKHKRPILRRGVAFSDALAYCFDVWTQNEQEEDGDTLYHTFIKEPWAVCETRWFTFRALVDGIWLPSVGPIFAVHRTEPIAYYGIARPDAPGHSNDLLGQPIEGRLWQNVADVTPDEDATYDYQRLLNVPGVYNAYFKYTIPPEVQEPILYVTVVARARFALDPVEDAGSQVRIGVDRYNGANCISPWYTLTDSYADYTYTWTTEPVTGNPWDLTKLSTAEIWLSLKPWPMPTKFAEARCTQVYILVGYQKGRCELKSFY